MILFTLTGALDSNKSLSPNGPGTWRKTKQVATLLLPPRLPKHPLFTLDLKKLFAIGLFVTPSHSVAPFLLQRLGNNQVYGQSQGQDEINFRLYLFPAFPE